jgi:Protein of unknown function (DUF1236)
MMRSPAALAAAICFFSTGVFAQTTTGTISEPLIIPEEQDVVVREYIVRRPVERIVEVPGGTVRPGSTIPRDIRLSPLADISAPGLRRYAYFVSPDNKIVIVDPATRQVMRIIPR